MKQHQQQVSSSKEELQQAQEVCREMLAARRSAREALSDMAQQNARLVSAYVEKKQELRHLQDNIREERLQWQVTYKMDTLVMSLCLEGLLACLPPPSSGSDA